MNGIAKYASFVKFPHTIFAAPFAMAGYVFALVGTQTPFEWLLLVKIVLCLVLARNTAMGFNRWADRKIDAVNPRTAAREIPSGLISPKAAAWFVAANAAGFVAAAWWINGVAFMLSPVALIIIMGYSYTKRFTAWSHIVLGTALSIAPAGAYIAVTGSISVIPILLAGIVVSWVAGFDILYSMQDAEHDRLHDLHSVPARFPARGAVAISILLHLVTVYGVVVLGMYAGSGTLYWIGSGLFAATLVCLHVIFRPSNTGAIARAFTLINGVSSIVYCSFLVADLLLR